MTDFENGLPPTNTDLTNKQISDVTIRADTSLDDGIQGIQSISIDTQASINAPTIGIQSVQISSEFTGKNLVMFYL